MTGTRNWLAAAAAACLSCVVLAGCVPFIAAGELTGLARAPIAASPVASAAREPAATGTVAQIPVAAQAPVDAEAPDSEEAGSFLAPSSEPPPIPEFLRRSGSKAGGPANELNTGDGRARETLPGGSVSQMLAGRDLYHGNYCGPGDRGPDSQPTDALDAICQRHDACYTQAGHRSCGCDRALRVSALRAAASRSLSRELRARAASVAESIPFMNCAEP